MAISELWLGWQDSNLRMSAPKADALPLGDTPLKKCRLKQLQTISAGSRNNAKMLRQAFLELFALYLC